MLACIRTYRLRNPISELGVNPIIVSDNHGILCSF